jgi:hypothetical protein
MKRLTLDEMMMAARQKLTANTSRYSNVVAEAMMREILNARVREQRPEKRQCKDD